MVKVHWAAVMDGAVREEMSKIIMEIENTKSDMRALQRAFEKMEKEGRLPESWKGLHYFELDEYKRYKRRLNDLYLGLTILSHYIATGEDLGVSKVKAYRWGSDVVVKD
jgi:hypothetical protein